MDAQKVRDETPTHIFNPLKNDLVLQEFNDLNEKITYTIPVVEISTYPKYLADILRKHLVDAIINERNLGYISPEERAEIQKETEVEL